MFSCFLQFHRKKKQQCKHASCVFSTPLKQHTHLFLKVHHSRGEPSRWSSPCPSLAARLSQWRGLKNEQEHETVAFVQASKQQKRGGAGDNCIFQASRQQKRAGTRDCCIFSSFQTAKPSSNTRMLQLFKLLDSKNKQEHQNVAFVQASRWQKRAGTRDCCIRFKLLHNKTEREHETIAFVKLLDGKNEQEHKTIAFVSSLQTAKSSGNTRLLYLFKLYLSLSFPSL